MNGQRVVYVDDQAPLLDVYKELLAMAGAKPSTLHYTGGSPQEIAECIIEMKPDVVLLDGTLSGQVSGMQVMEALVSNPKLTVRPVIIGFSGEIDNCKEFQSRGADGAVFKSAASIFENLAAISEIVARRSAA